MKNRSNLSALLVGPLWYFTALPFMGESCFLGKKSLLANPSAAKTKKIYKLQQSDELPEKRLVVQLEGLQQSHTLLKELLTTHVAGSHHITYHIHHYHAPSQYELPPDNLGRKSDIQLPPHPDLSGAKTNPEGSKEIPPISTTAPKAPPPPPPSWSNRNQVVPTSTSIPTTPPPHNPKPTKLNDQQKPEKFPISAETLQEGREKLKKRNIVTNSSISSLQDKNEQKDDQDQAPKEAGEELAKRIEKENEQRKDENKQNYSKHNPIAQAFTKGVEKKGKDTPVLRLFRNNLNSKDD